MNLSVIKQYNTYNKFVFAFLFIFLVSLTNSIFFNQIGYFGAMLVVFIGWYKTKKYPFYRTGLEIPFVLFLCAELISAVLSDYQSQAFTIFVKRLLLIPVVYLIASSADSEEKTKLYFNIFISAAILTVLVYLVFAYKHYITQLYQLESRGPSPFQYVMTAGGLMSFIVVILFAFLVDDKNKIRIKLLQLFAFLVASLALLSSYTRAAWIGAAFGILIILFVKKKWSIIIPILLIFFFFLFYYKSESNIVVYKIVNDKPELINKYDSSVRATDILPINEELQILADYEDGIKLIRNERVIQKISTPSPVTRLLHWKDNFYIAYLFDSRQILFKVNNDTSLKKISEFTSPGLTKDVKLKNQKYFVADIDSGLTVFSLEDEKINSATFTEFSGISHLDFYDSTLAVYDAKKSQLNFYLQKEFFRLIDSFRISTGIGLLWMNNGNAFFQTENELLHYTYNNHEVKKIRSYNVQGIFRMFFINDSLYGISKNGIMYKGSFNDYDSVLRNFYQFDFSPSGFYVENNIIYLTYNKRNRLLSIFDPYHETNLERIDQWKTGWSIFLDNPLFGVGDIDLKDVYSKYKKYYLKENFGHLHNNYVHFLVILGGIGFVVVIFMLLKIMQLHLKIYNTLKETQFASSYALGALASFAGFLVSGVAEWNFGDQEIITMVWFLLGLNIAFYHNKKLETE